MKCGKLIVIEAGDGCGKQTQTQLLYEALKKSGRAACKISFPDYESDGSALVKMYLRGDFGKEVDAVNAYAASTFFAVDRYASYKMKWSAAYLSGATIIADRYTTSNMVHQLVKIDAAAEREVFLNWLEDMEYEKLGLPRPDGIIFLDVPPKFSDALLLKRGSSSGSDDIHEADLAYLHRCYEAYRFLAKKYGWQRIDCISENGHLRSIEDIHTELRALVERIV